MFESLEKIAAAVGAVVLAGGTLTGLALWLFKLFGEKWLSGKFAERLEAFKADQQKEIEHLRFEINKLFDRATKVHQREFEVLPKAWGRLSKSYHAVKGLTSSLQSYPDVNRMNDQQIGEFLSTCPLLNWQKEELRSASDRNRYYQDAIFWHHLAIVKDLCRKSTVYLDKNGIFIQSTLAEKFHQIEEVLWAALAEYEMNKQHDLKPREQEALKKLLKEGEPLMKDLQTEVQKRLWT